MKCICSLLLLFLMACSNQPDDITISGGAANTSKIIPYTAALSTQSTTAVVTDDPTFEMTKDTISIYGPHSITRNILVDKNGDIWFASWQGIIKYDGNVFTNITLKEGLKHFHVFSIFEDHTGGLWFGMIGGGLYHYDGKFFTYYTTTDGLAGNNVMCIMEDGSGNIWFGTNTGLSRYNSSTELTSGGKMFTNYTTKDGLLDNSICSMLKDHTGKLWFATEGGINSCLNTSVAVGAKQAVRFVKEEALPFRHALSIIEDRSGKIWISSQVGLSCYYPSTADRVGGKSVVSVSGNFTLSNFEDKSGNLWLSCGELNNPHMVLFRCDPLQALKTGSKAFTKIASEVQVFGVTQDKNGNIWFGTMNGVRRYDGKTFTDFLEKGVK